VSNVPLTKLERQRLTSIILRGLGHDRYSDQGSEAYKIAKVNFTPHQLGALHRAMSRYMRDLEDLDLNT
jgi:hypothetical protein